MLEPDAGSAPTFPHYAPRYTAESQVHEAGVWKRHGCGMHLALLPCHHDTHAHYGAFFRSACSILKYFSLLRYLSTFLWRSILTT